MNAILYIYISPEPYTLYDTHAKLPSDQETATYQQFSFQHTDRDISKTTVSICNEIKLHGFSLSAKYKGRWTFMSLDLFATNNKIALCIQPLNPGTYQNTLSLPVTGLKPATLTSQALWEWVVFWSSGALLSFAQLHSISPSPHVRSYRRWHGQLVAQCLSHSLVNVINVQRKGSQEARLPCIWS